MKITVSIKEAVEMSGLSRTTIYSLLSEGKIQSVTIGRRRLIKVDSLHELLEAA